MALRLVTPPEEEPLTLEEVKDYLHVDDSDSDATISLLISAARAHIEGKDGGLNRAFVTQTWEYLIDSFPYPCGYNATYASSVSGNGEIQLPLAPVQSIESVKYYNTDGDLVALNQGVDFVADLVSTPAWILPGTSGWPSTLSAVNAVIVRFVAGYPPDESSPPDLRANVPPQVKVAMMMLVAHWFDNKVPVIVGSTANEVPMTVKALLDKMRVYL